MPVSAGTDVQYCTPWYFINRRNYPNSRESVGCAIDYRKRSTCVQSEHPCMLCSLSYGMYIHQSSQLTQPIDNKLNMNRTVTMLWCDKYGDSADCEGSTKSAPSANVVQDDPNNSPITLRMGVYFVHYNFVVPIEGPASISKFWFEVDEHNGTSTTVYNNGGNDYVIAQDQVIFVPTMSTAFFRSNDSYTKTYTNRNGEAFTKVYNLTVAVCSNLFPNLQEWLDW